MREFIRPQIVDGRKKDALSFEGIFQLWMGSQKMHPVLEASTSGGWCGGVLHCGRPRREVGHLRGHGMFPPMVETLSRVQDTGSGEFGTAAGSALSLLLNDFGLQSQRPCKRLVPQRYRSRCSSGPRYAKQGSQAVTASCVIRHEYPAVSIVVPGAPFKP